MKYRSEAEALAEETESDPNLEEDEEEDEEENEEEVCCADTVSSTRG